MDGLEWCGVRYDKRKNELAITRNAEMDISGADSDVKIFVIPTDEEAVFVEDVVRFLKGEAGSEVEYAYSFEHRTYRNEMRDQAFEEECRDNPQMRDAGARIPHIPHST
jgi:acetate kinase